MEKPGSLMLKDYLKEELSSCSSNGFKSFPRHQCCSTTTIKFLLEIDLKVKLRDSSSITKRILPRNPSRKLTFTTLQKASNAVVRVFKQLPFSSARKGFLPRSLSRKMLLRAFWKRGEREPEEIKRWKSFGEFLDEKEKPLDQNRGDFPTSSSGDSNSTSWTESEFTSEMNSEIFSENDAGKSGKDSPIDVVVGEDSIGEETAAAAVNMEEITKPWSSDQEEKEQFSPVSVLDFPFHDEEIIEGKKEKMIKRFENVGETQLEPLDLQKRFADSVIGSMSSTETKAYELLKLVKSTSNSHCFILHTENLLLDFFHEKLEEIDDVFGSGGGCFEEQVLKLTEEWINNKGGGMVEMEWGVEEGRRVYVKDMEDKSGKWRVFEEEKQDLALEFEAHIWISLLNELLIDFS